MSSENNNTTTTRMLSLDLLEENEGQLFGLPANPRDIAPEKFELLKADIQKYPQFLQYNALKVYPIEDGKYIVIGGNMRCKALKELGYKEVPCVVIPKETHVEELKAYVILDNSGFGRWDWAKLSSEDWDAAQLEDWGVDLPDEWGCLSNEGEAQGGTEEDDFDESKEDIEPRCHVGDIWGLGDHRLMCGDSTNAEDVKALMSGELADLLLTDPSYNVSYEGKTKDKLTIMNDSMEDSTFRQFLVDAFTSAVENLKAGGSFYIWHADSDGYNFRGACHEVGLQIRQCLIWNKNQLVIGRQDYQWKHEPCLYGWKDGASHFFINDRSQTTVLDFNKPQRNGEHPTMKPVELFGYCIKNSSREKEIVLDLFGGSGTSIIACEQLNRKCRTMEFDPHYCDAIIARWEKLTGNTATKIS